ncbi:ERAD-associated E3 ubiquitin-protein ligase HRD1B [Bienertia sinuspersici]
MKTLRSLEIGRSGGQKELGQTPRLFMQFHPKEQRWLHPFLDELSIVAVLVCGHLFHADCLEQTTRFEDRRDPPCPVCSGFVLKADAT